ncbi:movement protein [Sesamum angolense]|uniref:Movement protein n=1 Tax=Sesamum angolense TaxID=2727404 RepID=A0AAE1T475_9LAMI|nr:movement protein [Sesamum angolense]
MRESADFHTNTTPTFVGTRLRENPGRNPRRAPENTPWARTMLQPLHPYGAVLNLDVIDFRNMEKLIDEWVAAIKIAATTLELDKENFIKLVELSLEGSVKIGWDNTPADTKASILAGDSKSAIADRLGRLIKIHFIGDGYFEESRTEKARENAQALFSLELRSICAVDEYIYWFRKYFFQSGVAVDVAAPMFFAKICSPWREMLIQSYKVPEGQMDSVARRMSFLKDKLKDWCYQASIQKNMKRLRGTPEELLLGADHGGPKPKPEHTNLGNGVDQQGLPPKDLDEQIQDPPDEPLRRELSDGPIPELMKVSRIATAGHVEQEDISLQIARRNVTKVSMRRKWLLSRMDLQPSQNNHNEEDMLQTSESLSGFFSRMTVSNKTMERIMRQDSNLSPYDGFRIGGISKVLNQIGLKQRKHHIIYKVSSGEFAIPMEFTGNVMEMQLIPKEEILEELRKLMFDIHPRIAYNLADQDFSRVLTLHQDFKRKDLMKEGNRPYSITYRIAYALSNTHHSDLFLRKEYIEIPRIFKEFAKVMAPDPIRIPRIEDRITGYKGKEKDLARVLTPQEIRQPVVGRYEGMLEIAGHEFLVAGVAGRENGCMTLGLSFLEDHKPWGRKGNGMEFSLDGDQEFAQQNLEFSLRSKGNLTCYCRKGFFTKNPNTQYRNSRAKIMIGGSIWNTLVQGKNTSHYFHDTGADILLGLRREKAFNRIMPINFRSKRGDFDAKLTNPKMQDKRKFGKVLLSFRQQGLIETDSFHEESEEELKNLKENTGVKDPGHKRGKNKIEATLKIKEECKYEYVRYKPIQMNMEDKKDMQIIIKEHISLGLIEPGISAYSSPGFLVRNHGEIKRAPEIAEKGLPAFHFIKLQRPDMVAFTESKLPQKKLHWCQLLAKTIFPPEELGLWVCLTEMDKSSIHSKSFQQGEWIIPGNSMTGKSTEFAENMFEKKRMLIWENKLPATESTRMKACNMLHVGQWHNHVCPCCEKQEKPLFDTKIRVTQKKPNRTRTKEPGTCEPSAAVVWLEEVCKTEDLGYSEARRSNQDLPLYILLCALPIAD